MERFKFENKVREYKEKGKGAFVVRFDDGEIVANYYTLSQGGEYVDLWCKEGKNLWYVGNIKFNFIKDVYPLVSEELEKELGLWDFD